MLPIEFVDCFDYNASLVMVMNIINVAKLRNNKTLYKHHIVPRSYYRLYGKKINHNDDNIVYLTYEEHVKIHKLYTNCIKTTVMKKKMIHAYKLMSGVISEPKIYGGNHKSNKGQIPWNKGKKHSEETKQKMSNSHKGKKIGPMTDEHKKALCKPKNRTPDVIKANKERYKGKHWKIINNKRVWY